MSEEPQTRAYRGRRLVASAIWAALLIGPPGWAVYRAFQGGPWLASREVVRAATEYYGIIPDVGGVLVIWLLFWCIVLMMAVAPRRIR